MTFKELENILRFFKKSYWSDSKRTVSYAVRASWYIRGAEINFSDFSGIANVKANIIALQNQETI